MKGLLIYVLVFCFIHNLNGQRIKNTDCSEDSSQYVLLDTIIYNMAMRGSSEYIYRGEKVRSFVSKQDTVCSIKNYAVVFDKILSMGLDLTKRLPRGRRNSRISLDSVQMSMWQKEYETLNKEAQKINGLFFLFVEVKDEYEKKFSYIETSKHLKKEIEALIRYGAWTHPNELKKILLLRLRYINMDKYYKDMRDEE